MDNYRVFIENLTCSVELRVEDAKLNKVFNNLGGKLEELSGQCASFREKVLGFISSHQRNRKTLQHHIQLVELLEVPQLVDACARNGFHDEALELANFVNGLERRHLLAAGLKTKKNGEKKNIQEIHKGSVVIQSIVNDVHGALLDLRRQLIGHLSEETSLPKELQVVSTLRKLDSLLLDRQLSLERHNNPVVEALNDDQRERLRVYFLRVGEMRLRMEFLEARTLWLERAKEASSISLLLVGDNNDTNGLSDKTSADTSSSLMKGARGNYSQAIELLDMHRSVWFSIVTEYTALFDGQQYRRSDEVHKGDDGMDEKKGNVLGGIFGQIRFANSTEEDIGEAVASISSDGVLPEEEQEGEVIASTVLSAWMGVRVQSLIAQLERYARH